MDSTDRFSDIDTAANLVRKRQEKWNTWKPILWGLCGDRSYSYPAA